MRVATSTVGSFTLDCLILVRYPFNLVTFKTFLRFQSNFFGSIFHTPIPKGKSISSASILFLFYEKFFLFYFQFIIHTLFIRFDLAQTLVLIRNLILMFFMWTSPWQSCIFDILFENFLRKFCLKPV